MLGCTGYSWIWIRSVCALCVYLEVHAYMYLHMHLLLALAFRERVRMSVPVYQSRMGIPICVRLTTILTDVHA